MRLLTNFLAVKFAVCWCNLLQAHGIPLNATKNGVDQDFTQEYASIKHSLIYDLGYTEEFADLVEINLRRAVKEERERQKAAGILAGTNGTLIDLRQQGEDYEDEVTTPAGPTTPRASPADYVRGFAMIVTSLTQLNVRNFWGGFVNFFPPGQRESAQALVDAAFGTRPASWPTIPTTTTKLTTTTKDPDDIDSEESTTIAAAATPASISATTAMVVATATVASAPVPTAAPAASTVTRAATMRYSVRGRTPSPSGGQNGVTVFQDLLGLQGGIIGRKNGESMHAL